MVAGSYQRMLCRHRCCTKSFRTHSLTNLWSRQGTEVSLPKIGVLPTHVCRCKNSQSWPVSLGMCSIVAHTEPKNTCYCKGSDACAYA